MPLRFLISAPQATPLLPSASPSSTHLTMSPSVVDHIAPQVADTRPSKRPRKPSAAQQDLEDNKYAQNGPVDHIFITEGNVMKKPGGKKVRCCWTASWHHVASRAAHENNLSRPLYRVANADGASFFDFLAAWRIQRPAFFLKAEAKGGYPTAP